MAENTTKNPIYNDFTGWVGSDKYLSLKWGCYDGEWLDISNGKRVILATHNQNNVVQFPNSSKITTMWDIYTSNNWYIYDSSATTLYEFEWWDSYWNLRNYTTFNILGTEYTLVFWVGYISRYAWSSVYTTLTPSYTSTGWTSAGSVYTHTTGNTNAFTSSAAAVIWNRYRIYIEVTWVTAWSLEVDIGDSWDPKTITADGTYTYFLTATNTDALTLTPTTDFDWSIDIDWMYSLCNVEEWYLELDNLAQACPILEDTGDLYIGNGNALLWLGVDWVLKTYFTLSDNTEIIWITKVADQFVIWTRDWQWSRVHRWDWVSSTPENTIYWYNEIIQNVVNQWNYHIVMTGGDFGIKKIWKSNGNAKTMLYQIREWDRQSAIWSNTLVPPIPLYWWWSATNYYVNNVESLWDMVFMPWYNKIITYWHRTPWFPDALFPTFALKQTAIYSMYASEWALYVAYDNWSWCSVIEWHLDNYESMQDSSTDYYFGSRWYMTLNPIMYLWQQLKDGIKWRLWIRTPENTFMNLYYAIDREVDRYTFVVDETINAVTTDPVVWDIYTIWSTPRFEVVQVKKFLNYMFIECKETTRYRTPRVWSTLTKISWTGDATITYVDFHNYRYFDTITDTTEIRKRQWIRKFDTDIWENSFTEIQPRIELITRDGKYTPEYNDIGLYFDDLPDG